MRAFTSAITAAAFLLHLWLGCCAHHAHAVELPAEHASHGQDDHGDEHGCDHHDPAPPTGDCDEPDCVFVTTAPATVDQDLLAVPVWDVALLTGSGRQTLSCSLTRSGFDLVFSLPVRAHLLHQVFLN